MLAAGARFIVVGAHAMAAHGVPRATGDFDLFIEPEATNAQRVMAALRDFGAPLDAHGIQEAFGVVSKPNFRHDYADTGHYRSVVSGARPKPRSHEDRSHAN
jgi:hypothetical protein